jgi:hypothetical protein
VILGTRAVDRICRAVLFWRFRSGAALNRALIHLGAKLTWVLARFIREGVVAGIDDAGPQSATAATINRVGVRDACPTLEE